VSDFESGRLVPVDSAIYLHDGRVSSPMGRALIALGPEHRAGADARYNARELTWADVLAMLRSNGLEPGATPRDTGAVRTHGATP
jgi:hypothetical protein